MYLEFSSEIEKAIANSGLSIHEIVRREGVEADVSHGLPPDRGDEATRSRDVGLIVLASGAALHLAALGIARVLKVIFQKPHLCEIRELVAVRDAQGEIVRDSSGRPIMERRQDFRLLEPGSESSNVGFDASIDADKGLVLSFRASDEPRAD